MHCFERFFSGMIVGVSMPALELLLPLIIGKVRIGAFMSEVVLKVVKSIRLEVWIKVMYIGIFEEKIKFSLIS
jgi:hypothetical protein